MTAAIKLTIPDTLAKACAEIVRTQGYHNIQELTLTALRNHLAQEQKGQALLWLAQNKGKFKGKQPSRDERAKAVDEYFASGRDIFKDHGLK